MAFSSPDITSGWSQQVIGSDVRGFAYALGHQFLYTTYASGLLNVFYDVPLSASRTLYYSSTPYKFYKETIEQIYGTLLLTDNCLPLIADDGKFIAAT